MTTRRNATGHPIASFTSTELRALVDYSGWTRVTGPTPETTVGRHAVVYARGGWRIGVISQVGRTTVYVDVATPTSPDLITRARIGGRWGETGYLTPEGSR